MSYITGDPLFRKEDGKEAMDWVDENRPEDGLFKVYWKDVIDPHHGGATLDPEEGEGVRWEWYYKDGERADGESKGWFPNGNLKTIRTFKNGIENGSYIVWYENGQKLKEGTYKDGRRDGLNIWWDENGQKMVEETYKDGKSI